MKLTISGFSDCGLVRKNNEDAILIDESLGLLVVCDGLGGHAAGEVASKHAATYVQEYIQERKQQIEDASKIPGGYFKLLRLAEEAIQDACRKLYELACSKSDFAGMATTLTLCLACNGKAIVAHVGDCRLYISRSRRVHRLTTDHTMATELIQQGELEESYKGRYDNILTRSLGSQESTKVDTLLFDLLPGDTCILCSDGLSRYLCAEDEILALLKDSNLETTCQAMIEFARSKGGEDNISVIAFKVPHEEIDEALAQKGRKLETMLGTLESVRLFEGLPYKPLLQLLNATSLHRVDDGATLLDENEECPGLYMLNDGRLTIAAAGVRIGEIQKDEYFGLSALVRPLKSRAMVKAQQSSSVMLLKRQEFRKLNRRLPKLGNRLLRRLTHLICRELDRLPPVHKDGRMIGSWF